MSERDLAMMRAEAVGEESIARVEDVLRKHPRYFGLFSRTERGSELDREGRDIEVDLGRAARLANLDHFSIEVKSGPTGVFRFLANTYLRVPGRRIGAIGLGAAIVEYLFFHRQLLVMAGDEVQTEIRLMEQYQALHGYWYRRGRGEDTEAMLRGLFARFFGINEKELKEAAEAIVIARRR